jgi:eukaryotic-like serine/threonine-protein kinase
VPAGLIAILKRMMAKRPEDRFQTPASAALSLLPFTRRAQTPSVGMMPAQKGTLPAPSADTPLPAALARPNARDQRVSTAHTKAT